MELLKIEENFIKDLTSYLKGGVIIIGKGNHFKSNFSFLILES
jgi:hypothetical protein